MHELCNNPKLEVHIFILKVRDQLVALTPSADGYHMITEVPVLSFAIRKSSFS